MGGGDDRGPEPRQGSWGGGALSSYRDRGGALAGQGLLQENPVIAPGQLHKKMFVELFW